MFLVKFFLKSLVLNHADQLRLRVNLNAHALQFFQCIYVDMFNFNGNHIFIFSKIQNGVKIGNISLLKMMCNFARWSGSVRVQNMYCNVQVYGLLDKHSAQLTAAQNSQFEIFSIK